MLCNFDSVFKPFEPDWDKVNLTDNPPCATCTHKIELRQLHPGNTWDQPEECKTCAKRFNYLINCLQKLAYLEDKAKKEGDQCPSNK